MGHEISKHGSGLVRRDRSRTKFRRRYDDVFQNPEPLRTAPKPESFIMVRASCPVSSVGVGNKLTQKCGSEENLLHRLKNAHSSDISPSVERSLHNSFAQML
jgi:hypothetical protein